MAEAEAVMSLAPTPDLRSRKVTRVARSNIARIRNSIRLRRYDMTAHAMEEMAEDLLDIADVEHAVLNGRVARSDRDDPRE